MVVHGVHTFAVEFQEPVTVEADETLRLSVAFKADGKVEVEKAEIIKAGDDTDGLPEAEG